MSNTTNAPLQDRQEVALELASEISNWHFKHWYNHNTQRWIAYRVYKEIGVIVAFPIGYRYMIKAFEIRGSVPLTMQKVYTETFNERYPEIDEDDE